MYLNYNGIYVKYEGIIKIDEIINKIEIMNVNANLVVLYFMIINCNSLLIRLIRASIKLRSTVA